MSDDELQKDVPDPPENAGDKKPDVEAVDESTEVADEPLVQATEALETVADNADEPETAPDDTAEPEVLEPAAGVPEEPLVQATEALETVADDKAADDDSSEDDDDVASVPETTRNMFSDDAGAYEPTDEEVRLARRRALKLGLIGGAVMSVLMLLCVLLLILLIRSTA